jgi:hypothetical protein
MNIPFLWLVFCLVMLHYRAKAANSNLTLRKNSGEAGGKKRRFTAAQGIGGVRSSPDA